MLVLCILITNLYLSGVIFVVDSSERQAIQCSQFALEKLLYNPLLLNRTLPLLVLANKTDKHTALSAQQVDFSKKHFTNWIMNCKKNIRPFLVGIILKVLWVDYHSMKSLLTAAQSSHKSTDYRHTTRSLKSIQKLNRLNQMALTWVISKIFIKFLLISVQKWKIHASYPDLGGDILFGQS